MLGTKLKCTGTPMLTNCSKNMHSRGPTEQHFYVWEPHRGCLHKVKKVHWYPLIKEGQWSHNIGKWSHTPNYYTTDVIILGTANLSFNVELTSAVEANRTLVSNIGRAIAKKFAVKFEGNEIMSVDDFNMFAYYRDLWKTKSEKRSAIRQRYYLY